jgi:hypothetical protein
MSRLWNADSTAVSRDTLLMELGYSPLLPKATPIARGAMKSVVLDGYRLIKNGDGVLELYDFVRDTLEHHDLSKDSSHQAALENSRRALETIAPGSLRTRPAERPGS